MPRFNITPSALRQAETNPAAFLDEAREALYLGLEKLIPSLSTDQTTVMEEKHEELHMLLEVYERANTTARKACRNRRGPLRAEVRELIRQTVELGDPAGLLSDLRRREAELGEYYPELE